MTRLRQFAFGCAVLLSGATNALAFDTSACFTPTTKICDITSALEANGWHPADRADPQVADHITWMGMPQYFAGDSGGQPLEAVLDMKRMSATGILRKKDLETAKTRILSRKTDNGIELAKVTVVSLTKQHGSIHCAFSLSAKSVDGWSDVALNTAQFTRLSSTAPSVPNAQASKDVVALNRTALSAKLGTPIPSDAIIETYLSFLTKE